ncbi:hypothetical protein ACFL28_05020 [Candidatus Omnitrophota bacterium]
MKKVLIGFVVIILLGSSYFFNLVLTKIDVAEAVETSPLVSLEDEKQQGAFNEESVGVTGHFILDSRLDPISRAGYIMAVIDTISSVKPEFFRKTYPRVKRPEIVDAVFRYYQNHFTRRHERVIDVVLSGKLSINK